MLRKKALKMNTQRNLIDQLLEFIPASLVTTYERKHLNGRLLTEMSEQYKQIQRRSNVLRKAILWDLTLGLVLWVGFLICAMAAWSDKKLLWVCLFCSVPVFASVAVSVIIGNRAKQNRMISDSLSGEFLKFNDTVRELAPFGEGYEYGGHLELKVVSDHLVALALIVIAQEQIFEAGRLNLSNDVQTVIRSGTALEEARQRFEKMWVAVQDLEVFPGVKKQHFFDLAYGELAEVNKRRLGSTD
jgi:hypothetical protein